MEPITPPPNNIDYTSTTPAPQTPATHGYQLPPTPITSHPSPISPPPTVIKNKLNILLLVILLLVIVSGVVAAYFVKTTLDTKDASIRTLLTEKETAQADLAKAQERIRQLDNPQVKINDAKRKNDLGVFVGAVKLYRTTARSYPSTDRYLFQEEFGNKYVTKLPNFVDPNTQQRYEIVPVAKVQTPPGLTLGTIQYQWPGECAGSEFKDVNEDTKAAARILLETGETYCQNI